MGNAALLCAPSLIISNGGGGVRVVSSSDGRLTIYKNANTNNIIKAAEILQRNPGQFLCESSQLRVWHRIPGVCADEDMEIGHLYFLLPIEMLYSVLTHDELTSLFSLQIAPNNSKAFKQVATQLLNNKNITITSPHEYFCLFHNNNNSEEEEDSANGDKFTRQRSWEPALETIDETSIM